MANHEIVPASALTKGTADRKKSATSFSLPGFASSGTYSANFVIIFCCLDGHLTLPATRTTMPLQASVKTGSRKLRNAVLQADEHIIEGKQRPPGKLDDD